MNVTEIRDLCLEAKRLYDQGDGRGARAQATAAVAVARVGAASGPHYALGLALTTAGLLAAQAGDGPQARQAFDEAVAIARAIRGDDPEHAITLLAHAAAYLRAEGEAGRAAVLDEEGLATLGEAVGTDHLRYQQLKARLARPGAQPGA